MQLNQLPDQRQANAHAALGPIDGRWALHKRLENLGQQLRRHADALVLHAEHGIPADLVQVDLNGAVCG